MIKRTCEKQKRRKRVAQLNIIIRHEHVYLYYDSHNLTLNL
jgi:hypothetical protein